MPWRISTATEVERDFYSDNPYKVLLSDISELAVPAVNAYLSPTADCFDGLPVVRRIREYLNKWPNRLQYNTNRLSQTKSERGT